MEEIKTGKKYLKECSSPLAIREMQIETTSEILPHPSQNSHDEQSNLWQAPVRTGNLAVGGSANWYTHSGDQYGESPEGPAGYTTPWPMAKGLNIVRHINLVNSG